jgi:hypothetical protein
VAFFPVSKSLKIGSDGDGLYLYVGCNISLFQYVFMAAYLENQTSYRQVVMNRRSITVAD